MQCDLCRHEEAIANGPLCPVCQDAIIRLRNAVKAIEAGPLTNPMQVDREMSAVNSRQTSKVIRDQEKHIPQQLSFVVECSAEECAAACVSEMCGRLPANTARRSEHGGKTRTAAQLLNPNS
jgi:hypothetical protein